MKEKIFGSEWYSAKHFTAEHTVLKNTWEYLKNKKTEKYTARANTGEYGKDYAEILLSHSVTDNQSIGNWTEYRMKKLVAE